MSDSNSQEILTLAEVASYLKIAEKTVLRMIARDEIPCVKVASQWRFMKGMIDDWLISRMNVVPQNDLARVLEQPHGLLPLSRLLRAESILTEIVPGTKRQILEQLIKPLVQEEFVVNPQDFLDKLLKREKMVSTAIGRGIAIPHLRHPKENPGGEPRLVLGVCRPGTDYESLDGKLTHLFFLVISDSEVLHLRTLAKLNQILREGDFTQRLIDAPQGAHLSLLLEGEARIQANSLSPQS